MTPTSTIVKPEMPPEVKRGVFNRFAQIVVAILVECAVLFGAAGRLDWTMAWVLIGVQVLVVAVNAIVLLPGNQEMIAERARSRKEDKPWDPPLAITMSLLGPIVIWLVAGLDLRFGWQPPVPLLLSWIGIVSVALGYALTTWAMASNRFFSGFVRIQTERGHVAVTGGPYRFVRHPGYAGMSLFTLATPLVLGSWWALIPVALTLAVTVIRTRLEDRTLQEELDGYRAYAGRVRYRLLPGIW